MLTLNRPNSDDTDEQQIRDIHALTPPRPGRGAGGHQSSSLSISSELAAPTENFTTMSQEFNALVLSGSTIENSSNFSMNSDNYSTNNNHNPLSRIGEEDVQEETNPLAMVPDNNPFDSGRDQRPVGPAAEGGGEVSLLRVKKEEVESKISAWQNAKIAKINNRFKREDSVINGWESEQFQKANSWMKKVERRLEEKRAKAVEKMQNEVARARRKAEERRASAEGKRGTKVAKVVEIADLMRAIGRAPAKRSFF